MRCRPWPRLLDGVVRKIVGEETPVELNEEEVEQIVKGAVKEAVREALRDVVEEAVETRKSA